jgi:maltokinase
VVPQNKAVVAERMVIPLQLLDELVLTDTCRLAVTVDARGSRFAAPMLLTPSGNARRAVPGDGAAEGLVRLLTDPRAATPASFRVTRLNGAPAAGERAIAVDQTNESVIVGEAAVVKWQLALPTDEHSALSRVAALDAAGFRQMPESWGFVEWLDPRGRPTLLASVTAFLAGARDGWEWCVEDARAAIRGGISSRAATDELAAMVADMHVALAADLQPADSSDVASWTSRAQEALDEALLVVDGPEGERLRRLEPQMREAIDRIGRVGETSVFPIHGDLHVGQFLRHDAGYAIADFDGSPVVPQDVQSHRQPAARDVAAMLQSLDHVGRVVQRRTQGVDPEAVERWIAATCQDFLAAYRQRLKSTGHSELFDDRLLLPFAIEQECREFIYAVRHLPHWRYVPDEALPALMSRVAAATDRDGTDR